MKRHATIWTATAVVCLAAAPGLRAGPVRCSFKDGTAVVATDRWEISWREGCMVGAKSLLPRERAIADPARAMKTADLPAGSSSVHGVTEQDLREQHHPWGFYKTGKRFAAVRQPTEKSAVRAENIPNGIRLTYTGLGGDETGTLVQDLAVERQTGDLVIAQKASSANPGLFGIGFSVLNIRPDMEFVTPYFSGQRWTPEHGKDGFTNLARGSVFWGADFVIGEMPEGGSFVVWAENPRFHPTYFRKLNTAGGQGLNFEANEEAPYDAKKSVEVCAWRFNTYPGGWMDPARRYKEWMVKTYAPVPRNRRTSKWADEISLVYPYHFGDEAGLKQMAEIVAPNKTLIMNWGFVEGFNRRVPEYRLPPTGTVSEPLAAAIKKTRELGFRTGIYTSLALVDRDTHPDIMREYGLDFYYSAPSRMKPSADASAEERKKHWLVYVHPGSAKWHEYYANRMAEVQRVYGIDYFYQDVTGCATGSSGLVDGRTFNEGVIACEKEIRRRAPDAALGGEYWNIVNALQEDFGIISLLAWGGAGHAAQISRPRSPHPVLSYIFGEYCVLWPHHVQIRDTLKFHQSMNINEVIGAIPIWSTTPDDRVSEARVTIERARLWADGFRPYFPEKWRKDAVAYMRNPAGRTVAYLRPDESTWCVEETRSGDRLVYGRVTNKSDLATREVRVDGWLAYGPKGPIGLNPTAWYSVFPGKPDDLPVYVTGLPAGAYVRGTRSTDRYVLAEIEGTGTGTVSWRTTRPGAALFTTAGKDARASGGAPMALPAELLFGFAEPAVPTPDAAFDLAGWDCRVVANGQAMRPGTLTRKSTAKTDDGKTFATYMVSPPTGGKGSEISFDGFVAVPQNPKAALAFRMGRLGGIGDGVNFIVRINGREVFRQFSEPNLRSWKEGTVPLANYAGRPVLISLAIDCGKDGGNTSNDQSLWGDVRIATP